MELVKTENPGRWKPGQSGNVNGLARRFKSSL